MKTKKNNITTLDEILDKKYCKKGQPKREEWEQQFEAFRLVVLLEEARIKLGMTQEELAKNAVPINRTFHASKIIPPIYVSRL